MVAPVISKSFQEGMNSINKGLFVIWDEWAERFQIMHRDPRTGLIRCIVMVENEDGTYRPCDNRTLHYLRERVSWELIERYPNPADMANAMKEKMDRRKLKEADDKREYRRLWNKEHRAYWRGALENAKRGIMDLPDRKTEKIIIASGVSPKNSKVETKLSLVT